MGRTWFSEIGWTNLEWMAQDEQHDSAGRSIRMDGATEGHNPEYWKAAKAHVA
jgi:hypothetical protein